MKSIKIIILTLFLTQNLLAQWNRIYDNNNILTICVADSNNVYFTHKFNSNIYKSINGGLLFDSIASPIMGNINYFTIQFPTKDTGYAAGGAPFSPYEVVIKTTNGGVSWNTMTSNIYGDLAFRKMQFVTNDIGYFQGSKEPMKTINGCNSMFDIINLSQYKTIDDFDFITPKTGYIAIHKSSNLGVPNYVDILKTYDYGNSWSSIYSDTLINNEINFITKLEFLDTLIGFAISSKFIPYGGVGGVHVLKGSKLLKTTNGGASWSVDTIVNMDSITTNRGITDIHFINKDTGYICNQGKIYKTTNSGNIWQLQQVQDNDYINNFNFYNNDIAYAVGQKGIYKTTRGGDFPLPIIEKVNKKNINIYPNPVTDFLAIKPEINNASYNLFNSIGQLIKQENNIQINKIDFTFVDRGFYYLQIKNDKEILNFKVLKN
jgi:photosystem II stability/assembly factor-like uncharacterized protein